MNEKIQLSAERKKLFYQYLLGELTSEQSLLPIEEAVMSSEKFFEELEIVEEELIQEYVDGYLDEIQVQNFCKNFLNSEERNEKVKFAESLRDQISRVDFSELRAYLLGQIDSEEKMTSIEIRLLEDDKFFEKFLVTECTLREDGEDSLLNEKDQEAYDKYFLATRDRLKDLEMDRNLRKLAKEANSHR